MSLSGVMGVGDREEERGTWIGREGTRDCGLGSTKSTQAWEAVALSGGVYGWAGGLDCVGTAYLVWAAMVCVYVVVHRQVSDDDPCVSGCLFGPGMWRGSLLTAGGTVCICLWTLPATWLRPQHSVLPFPGQAPFPLSRSFLAPEVTAAGGRDAAKANQPPWLVGKQLGGGGWVEWAGQGEADVGWARGAGGL